MIRKQLLIVAGITCAIAVMLAVVFLWRWGDPTPAPADAGERLAYAWRWMLVPGLALMAGIGLTASLRFFLPGAIDGDRRVENRLFEVNQRYIQNTLEQTVLAAVAWSGLALVLPEDQLGVVARLAVLFGVGRALFWVGYLYAPWARAFGMAMTAYPSFIALVWLAWLATGL